MLLSFHIGMMEQIRQMGNIIDCVMQRLSGQMSLDDFFDNMVRNHYFISISKKKKTQTNMSLKRQLQSYIMKIVSFALIMNKSSVQKYLKSKKLVISSHVYDLMKNPWCDFQSDKFTLNSLRSSFCGIAEKKTTTEDFWNDQQNMIAFKPIIPYII
jgi:hypothetical protein